VAARAAAGRRTPASVATRRISLDKYPVYVPKRALSHTGSASGWIRASEHKYRVPPADYMVMDAHAVWPRLATTAALVVAVAAWALVWTTPAHAVISFRSATSAGNTNATGVTIAK